MVYNVELLVDLVLQNVLTFLNLPSLILDHHLIQEVVRCKICKTRQLLHSKNQSDCADPSDPGAAEAVNATWDVWTQPRLATKALSALAAQRKGQAWWVQQSRQISSLSVSSQVAVQVLSAMRRGAEKEWCES